MAPATHDRSVTLNAPAHPADGQGVRARCMNALFITFLCGLLGACATATTQDVSPDDDDNDTTADAGDSDIVPEIDETPDGSANPGDTNPGSDTGSDTAPDTAPDVAPFCGDGTADPNEECDDGLDNSDTVPDACRRDCTLARCGDGVVDSTEGCDDANDVETDFCSSACVVNQGDICRECDEDVQCGSEFDACVLLGTEGYCGLSCTDAAGCPRGFECRDVRSTTGASTRQCIPASGGCEGCFDPDRDGFGIGPECEGIDCRPSDASSYPGATETCDGVDNNCDGTVDEGLTLQTWYRDADQDGFGNAAQSVQACQQPEGTVASADDCDDSSRSTYPGAAELCDGLDNDCNDVADNGAVPRDFWPDRDGDGAGDRAATPTESCAPIAGSVTNGTDCNDGNADVRPGGTEACTNAIDDNCDGSIDCADAACAPTPFCTCSNDALEPNDEPANAIALSRAPFNNLRVCEDDVDLFLVPLGTGDVLDVSLNHIVVEGDVDLGLFNAAGELVTGSYSESGTEEFQYAAVVAGDYYVAVVLFEDAGTVSGNTYSLTIDVEAGATGCTDDANEPDDTLSTFRRGSTGTLPSLRACAGDADVTGIALNIGDTISVSVDFRHAEGDIDLILVDPAGEEVAISETTTDDESLSWQAEIGGTHYIVVVLYDDLGVAAGNTYSLTVAIDPTDSPCRTDAREENDSPVDAPQLGAGNQSGLFVCTLDDDWFRYQLNAGQRITATVTFNAAVGDVDVQLISSTGAVIDSSTGVTGLEDVSWLATTAATVYLRVYVFPGAPATVPYELATVFAN